MLFLILMNIKTRSQKNRRKARKMAEKEQKWREKTKENGGQNGRKANGMKSKQNTSGRRATDK